MSIELLRLDTPVCRGWGRFRALAGSELTVCRLFAQRNQTGFANLPILEVSLRTGVRVRDFDIHTSIFGRHGL